MCRFKVNLRNVILNNSASSDLLLLLIPTLTYKIYFENELELRHEFIRSHE